MKDKSIFDSVFTEIERKADALDLHEGDYIKDGLIYCGVCKEPRQAWYESATAGRKIKIITSCRCEKEKRLKAEQEKQMQMEREKLFRMRKNAFADKSMEGWTFDTDDHGNPKLTEIAHKYVDNFEKMGSKGLLLYGGVGTGKTYMTACIANALIDKSIPCYVTSFARITNTVSGLYDDKQEYIDGLNRFRLLVIDDLASERDTEYMGEIVQNVIDTRYSARLPLIVTTNLTGEQLKYPSDIRRQRIYSRLFDMCIPYEVKGKDRRKENLKEDYTYYKDLLGI